jgi:hypothetical protein
LPCNTKVAVSVGSGLRVHVCCRKIKRFLKGQDEKQPYVAAVAPKTGLRGSRRGLASSF